MGRIRGHVRAGVSGRPGVLGALRLARLVVVALRRDGVLGRSGFPSRWTFYIGIDGRILTIDKHVRTGRHGFDIEKTLNEFQITLRG